MSDATKLAQRITPGPWHVEHYDWNLVVVHEDVNDPRLRTAVCDLRPSSEQHSNAELIALAPSLLAQRDALLAACKLMLPLFEDYVVDHESPSFKGSRNFVAEQRAALTQIRAAIALAGGGK